MVVVAQEHGHLLEVVYLSTAIFDKYDKDNVRQWDTLGYFIEYSNII